MTTAPVNCRDLNPLLEPIGARIDALLAANPLLGELKEGDLLLWLRTEGWVDEALSDGALYKVHFLMRNALYRLVSDYPGFQWQLDALGLRWQAKERSDGETTQALLAGQNDPTLAEYYLDWANLDLSAEDVARLLDSFWRRYAGFTADEQIAPALAVLGLSQMPADLAALKQQYRRRVARVHPDRVGVAGATAEVQRLNAAYATLKLVLKAQAL